MFFGKITLFAKFQIFTCAKNFDLLAQNSSSYCIDDLEIWRSILLETIVVKMLNSIQTNSWATLVEISPSSILENIWKFALDQLPSVFF